MDRVWEEGGKAGRFALVLLFVGMMIPFLFNLGLALFIYSAVWPKAATLQEQLFVLGILAVLVNAIAIQVSTTAWGTLQGWFLRTMPRRRRRPSGRLKTVGICASCGTELRGPFCFQCGTRDE